MKKNDIENADHWFDTKGNKTVFFCRFIPLIRSLISIPAGMSEMPVIKFLIFTILGSLIWNIVLIAIGSVVGENWVSLLKVIKTYSYIIVALSGIIIIIVVFLFYKKRLKKH